MSSSGTISAENKALVLFSAGQDSTTCLAWALKKFSEVHALTIDYVQRDRIEIEQARKIAGILKIPHEVFILDLFSKCKENALTHPEQIITPGTDQELPTTFVPGRNLIFLSVAAMKAYQLGIKYIVAGVCQTDYSGYPDCREEFIRSFEKTINLAMLSNFNIQTPLMFLTKKQSITLMRDLGKLELLEHSHTCYEGRRPACRKCPACLLRLKGFKEAGIIDPLEYQSGIA